MTLLLAAGAGFLFFWVNSETEPAAIVNSKNIKESFLRQAQDGERSRTISPVELSGHILEQGDTLFIKIKNATSSPEISGKLGKTKINFFQRVVFGDPVAIVGIDAKASPGKYDLNINLPDGKNFKKEILVAKREFPVTDLKVTKELEAKGFTPSKIVKNIVDKEKPTLDSVLKVFTSEVYFAGAFMRPLKEIKVGGEFGNIRKRGTAKFQHLGVDLDASVGTPVGAANDGVVSFSEELDTYGKTLVVNHGIGIYSLYLHLDKIEKKTGEFVEKGEVIAFSGNTGYSIQPHLHFSVKVNGASVDPLRFIQTSEKHL